MGVFPDRKRKTVFDSELRTRAPYPTQHCRKVDLIFDEMDDTTLFEIRHAHRLIKAQFPEAVRKDLRATKASSAGEVS
jgi:hypothetical protein